MNNFLPNHNFKHISLNKIELDNFINKCKSSNILKTMSIGIVIIELNI